MSLSLVQRIMRLQNKPAALVKLLSRVQILTRTKDKEFHSNVVQRAQRMLQLASEQLNAKKLEELIGIIDELADACTDESNEVTDTNTLVQRMFCNMGLHQDVLSIVMRPIEADKSVGPKGRSAVLCACYGFLKAFVRHNPDNQHLLYEQMDFMLSQMLLYARDVDVPRAIAECLTEVYRDNVELCSLVSEQSLRPVPPSPLCSHHLHSFLFSTSFHLLSLPYHPCAHLFLLVRHDALRIQEGSDLFEPLPHRNQAQGLYHQGKSEYGLPPPGRSP